MREYLYILIIAAVVTYLLTPLVRRFAVAINAQHAPRSRDTHTAPTPLLGGLAMSGGLLPAFWFPSRFAFCRRAFLLPAPFPGLSLPPALRGRMGIGKDR